MKTLAKHVSSRVTPQSRPIPGKKQEQNNAGGYTFVLDSWGRLQRFLILGSDGGTYYVGEQKLTANNAGVVMTCATIDAERTVEAIAGISEVGRAPKNDAAIFALALVASQGDDNGRRLALGALPRVCRTATHLFQFVANCKELRGWGRGLREAVAAWYNDKPVEKLAYQVTKYRNRAGYTHRDVLRLSHPKTKDGDRNDLYGWIVSKVHVLKDFLEPTHPLWIVEGFEEISSLGSGDEKRAAHLIQKYGLTLEHIPTTLLGSVRVWEALLPNLPPTALIRNLGKMTSIGLLKPLAASTNMVCNVLTSPDRLRGARVHPLSVLIATETYSQGHGIKGSLTWQPVGQIRDALEEAFYSAFDAIELTGKRHLLSLDVSGSMGWSFLANTHLSAAKAAACMAMVTHRLEPQTHVMGFSHNLVPIDISKKERLDALVQKISRIPMGGTDCAIPMMYATQQRLEVDAFVVYTDNETWAGQIHPTQALKQYRQIMGIDAKLIVVGMTATPFTIADPSDAGMLDVVGFDASCPAVMADFVR
jgi:60 kDa SS-A/Ro ribonucleoprotein